MTSRNPFDTDSTDIVTPTHGDVIGLGDRQDLMLGTKFEQTEIHTGILEPQDRCDTRD